jgi:hypothetical protein
MCFLPKPPRSTWEALQLHCRSVWGGRRHVCRHAAARRAPPLRRTLHSRASCPSAADFLGTTPVKPLPAGEGPLSSPRYELQASYRLAERTAASPQLLCSALALFWLALLAGTQLRLQPGPLAAADAAPVSRRFAEDGTQPSLSVSPLPRPLPTACRRVLSSRRPQSPARFPLFQPSPKKPVGSSLLATPPSGAPPPPPPPLGGRWGGILRASRGIVG